ncbi:MAG: RIP metalloprotease RseP [Planifilum fulgidum]
MLTNVAFVLVLSALVFIHELGHFLFAKRAGILVREFAIGFGPKLFSVFKGETLYSIRALPLGGFVRMAGEDPETVEIPTGSRVTAERDDQGRLIRIHLGDVPAKGEAVTGKVMELDLEKELYLVLEDEEGRQTRFSVHPRAVIQRDEKNVLQIAPRDRQFGSKTVGQRAATILAGPVFNILLSVILFAILTMMTGVETKVSIYKVNPGSPAAQAGLKAGDEIVSIDGEPIRNTEAVSMNIQKSKGEPLTFEVRRAGSTFELEVDPEWNEQNKMYWIDVQLQPHMRKATLSEAVASGFKDTYLWTVRIFDGFGQLITGQIGIESLGGPVQIASITGQAAEAGSIPLIRWTALLSLYLGVFNLLPIPALDGSRLAFIAFEAIRGRPVDPNKESLVHFVGFALLMMLMLVVTYNDIMRVFFSG